MEDITIQQFMSMFNTNKQGDFKTSLDKTHGQLTLRKGKLVNVNRYDRGKTDDIETNPRAPVTTENYNIRMTLLAALKAAGVNEDSTFYDDTRKKLGLDNSNLGLKKARPLSRRTVKAILSGYQTAKKNGTLDLRIDADVAQGPNGAQQAAGEQAVGEQEEKAWDVETEVKNVITDVGGGSVETLFDQCKPRFMQLSSLFGKLEESQADNIVKDQIANGTPFGQALKQKRENAKKDKVFEFSSGENLSPIGKSFAAAIDKYLKYGDIETKLDNDLKKVRVCNKLMENFDESAVSPFGLPIRLCMAIGVASVADPHEKLSSEDAEKIITYLVDAMTDLGLELEKLKKSGEVDKQAFANAIKDNYGKSTDARRILWDALLKHVGIVPN